MEELLTPDSVHVCDGSKKENQRLLEMEVERGAAVKLNPESVPSHISFVVTPRCGARGGPHLHFFEREEDAGPTNNWVDPRELKPKMLDLFRGSMKGRVMYVIPFCMGPLDSPFSKLAVQITDSPYVVTNMRIMTRMGTEVLERLDGDVEFVPCLHSVGAPLEEGEEDVSWPCAPMEDKYISHFPETREIWSSVPDIQRLTGQNAHFAHRLRDRATKAGSPSICSF